MTPPDTFDDIPVLAAWPAELRSDWRTKPVPAGTALFSRGERPRAMYGVLSGEVRLVRHSRDGEAIVLQRARRGLLAEANLDQPAYHCDAIAAAVSTVIAIPLATFRLALAHETPRAAWIAHLAGELRRARAQNERLALRSAEARIVHYVETEGREGRIVLSGTRKALAAELGLTHEALYRAIARLSREGRLEARGRILQLASHTS